MSTKYTRVKINSSLKSDQTTKRVINFTYNKTYGDAISTADITLKRTNTSEDQTDFLTGKPVQVWMSDTLVAGQVEETSANIIFDGYIDDPDIELFKIILKCSDRLVLTKWSETGPKEEYGVDTSVKTIFADLVSTAATATGKTINLSTAADATTPVNLNRYSTENNNIYEKLWELSNIVNWQFYYDPTDTYVAGGCIRFEPRGKPINQNFYNKVASTGSPLDQNGNIVTWSGKTVNIAGLIGWQTDSKDLTNNLNVIGGQTEVTVSSEHHTVTGGTTNYILSDTNAGGGNTNTQIFNISVIANPGAVTLTQGGHYVVYVSASPPGFINFPVAPSALGYTDLYFTYTYKFSAAAGKSANNPTSIASYIKRSKTVPKRDIISPIDVLSYLTTLLGGFKDPITEVSFESKDAAITPIIGSLASIHDGIISKVLISTGTPIPIITRTIKHWPQPTTTVTVSTKPLKYENQTQTYFDRIDKTDKELTATNAKPFFKMDGSTPIQGDVTFGGKADGGIPEIKTPVIHKLATAPVALTEGQLYYNTTGHAPWFYNGTAWTVFGGGGTWGSITGTLSNQTDLQNALDAKLSLGGGIMTDNIQFNSYKGNLFYGDGVYCGFISGYLSGTARGVVIDPAVGSSSLIFIGQQPPAGDLSGVSVTDTGISLKTSEGTIRLAATGYNIGLVSTTGITLGISATNLSVLDAQVFSYVNTYIKKTNPVLYFQAADGSGLGDIQADTSGMQIRNDVNAKTILLRTGASPVTRLTVSDTALLTSVPFQIEDTSTYLDNVTGNLEIHVAAGKSVKIVVG